MSISGNVDYSFNNKPKIGGAFGRELNSITPYAPMPKGLDKLITLEEADRFVKGTESSTSIQNRSFWSKNLVVSGIIAAGLSIGGLLLSKGKINFKHVFSKKFRLKKFMKKFINKKTAKTAIGRQLPTFLRKITPAKATKILGVNKNATPEEIRTAFRASRQVLIDSGKVNKKALAKLHVARDILLEPYK